MTPFSRPQAINAPAAPGFRRAHRLAVLGLLAALLAGCSDGGGPAEPGATPPPPPPPPSNRAPLAAFTAAAAVAVGEPLVLDATGSSDADGDPLAYAWRFGDGAAGGGSRIAHTFAAPGRYTVALTVDDGRGGRTVLERAVDVNPGANAVAVVATLARVRDGAGAPLAGVSVSATVATPGVPGTPTASTNAQGEAVISTGTGVPVVLKFSKPGYADQWRNASLPAGAEDGWLEVVMQPREAPLVLASAAAGGALAGRDGARVVFEPGSLVDGTGNAVSGPVQVSITPVDVGRNLAAFPGRFAGTRPTGQQGLIVSYGTVEYALSAGGAPVQLAPGRKATIEIPVYTTLNLDGSEVRVGDSSPLWSLNERTGGWTEEGSGTVVASAASPSGLALRAEVTHFSWWNHDAWTGPGAKPKPRCKVDTNADGVLEDLTDTGHCWHIGTGLDLIDALPSGTGPGPDRARALRARISTDAQPTRRLPAFAAYDSTPTGGGKVLEVPANFDVMFRSYAANGTLFGMKVVNLGPGVEQEVEILLTPIADNPGTQAISLPYDRSFLLKAVGETDAFTFSADGASEYEIKVEAAPGSLIRGSAQVLGAASAPVASGSFSTSGGGFIGVVPAGVSGTVTVRVNAASSVPGAYRITVRRITAASGACLTTETLAMDAAALPLRVLRANSLHCWTLDVAAGEWLEIRNQQVFDGATGTISLRAPDGRVLASDPYGAAAGPTAAGMLLRMGLAEAGTYRVEITNTIATQALFQGLQARRLAGVQVLGATGSVTLTDVNGPSAVPRFVGLQRAAGSEPGALLTQGPARYTVYPSQQVTNSTSDVEILALAPPVAGMWPVVEFSRAVTGSATPVTVSLAPTTALGLDSNVSGTGPAAGSAAALFFEATAGTEISWGFASTGSSGAQLRLVAPSGTGAGGVLERDTLVRLAETGRYTVAVATPAGSSPAPYTVRVNTATPPVPLARSTGPAPIVLEGSLALGQVLRWSLPVLATDAISPLRVEALNSGFGALALLRNGNALIDRHRSGDAPTGPLWVTADGTWTLLLSTLNNPGGSLASQAGDWRLTVGQLAPLPLALDEAFSRTLAANEAVLLGLAPGATTPVRWCLRPTPATATVDLFSRNTTAELSPAHPGGDASLRHGIGTLAPGGNRVLMLARQPATASLRIVPNPTPDTLALGAAAVAGTTGPCRSGYHRFAGTPGTAYTARIEAGFEGTVRVHFQNSGTDWVSRGTTVSGLTRSLTAGGVTVHGFTLPTGIGAGTWIIEVEAAVGSGGSYTLQLSSP